MMRMREYQFATTIDYYNVCQNFPKFKEKAIILIKNTIFIIIWGTFIDKSTYLKSAIILLIYDFWMMS